MSVSFLSVVVIYRKKPRESSTLASLARLGDRWQDQVRVLLWDNSPEPWDNATVEEAKAWLRLPLDYRHNGGENIGLSTLYNRSIREMDEHDYLWILDDDSLFEPAFIEKAVSAIQANPTVDLFLPIVRSNHLIASPAHLRLFKGHFYKAVTPGLMSSRHRTAINSGMIVSGRYLKGDFPGYDEQLSFYGTDNDFMMRYRDQRTEFYVLDYTMSHSLDFYHADEPFEKKSARFVAQNRSLIHLMRRRGLLSTLGVHLYLFAFSCKYALLHRDPRYLFVTWTRK